MTGLIIVGVIVLLIAVLAIWFVKVSNNFKRIGTAVEQTKADIEVYMIKRYDVLMNSMKVAKEFASHCFERCSSVTILSFLFRKFLE